MYDWCREPPPRLLRRGIEQFNRGEYFQQHETLEELWRTERRDIRRLYQGILQIGVAMYHVGNHNRHGAVYLLRRGSRYLRPFCPTCQSVDVADLLSQASRILESVENLDASALSQFDWTHAPLVLLSERPYSTDTP